MHLTDGLGRPGDSDLDFDRVAHDSFRHAADIIRHGSREHDRLAVSRQTTNDRHDIVIEAHIQHTVRFIEDKILHPREIDIVYIHLAEEPSRSSDHYIRSFLQAGDLGSPSAVIPSAIDSNRGEGDIETESLHLLVYLLRQFAGRRHDNGIQFVGIMGVESQIGEEREDICSGLACAGLGTGDDVMSLKNNRDRLLLDGRAGIEMHVPQGVKYFV